MFGAGDRRALESEAMTAVGAAALRVGPLDPAVVERFHSLAARDPLNTQPLLFAGALADRVGEADRAASLYRQALIRDPRSLSAHYFVATRALRSGKVSLALRELSQLGRLNPHAVDFEAAFVSYAKANGDIGTLKRFLAAEPERRDSLLNRLALDPANADLVVELAGRSDVGRTPDPDWRGQLMKSLVAGGRFAEIRDRWKALTGGDLGSGLTNPTFGTVALPQPFDWTYRSGDQGLVEPATGGKLSLVYYGRGDGVLAEQTMLLVPGTYEMSMVVEGSGSANAVGWTVSCAGDRKQLALLPLSPGRIAVRFTVTDACPAQKLELQGAAALSEGRSQWTIGQLNLARVGA